MTAYSAGYFYTKEGSWAFLALSPLTSVNPLNATASVATPHSASSWILLLQTPQSVITHSARAYAELVAILLLISALPIFLMAWFVADTRVRKKFLRKQEQEREELRKVQSLARGVAHEFRQPLAALKLASDMIKLTDSDPTTVSSMSQRIPKSVERIDDLVKQLLSITQVETIPYPGDTEIINLAKQPESPPSADNSK